MFFFEERFYVILDLLRDICFSIKNKVLLFGGVNCIFNNLDFTHFNVLRC